MLANRTDRALVALLVLVVCTIAYATSAITATAAQAYTLGAADGNPAAAPIAAHVGARTYRIVMDPNAPLDAYADRIEAFRAHGMRPQIVVGGTGTTVRGRTTVEKWQIVNTAIHAFERWPDTYSVSVINEPDLAGVSACQYAKTYRTAYRMLKRAGVPRVLFGEFSPLNPLRWTKRALDCVGSLKTDGWAWHEQLDTITEVDRSPGCGYWWYCDQRDRVRLGCHRVEALRRPGRPSRRHVPATERNPSAP